MAGGIGSRMWPLSRASFPKQFQPLIRNKSSATMLQQTFSRLSGLNFGRTQLICNKDHRFLAVEQCRTTNIPIEIVLEPVGRNTAPAVILAALRLAGEGNDDPMLVLSADHAIEDEDSFHCALVKGHELAIMGNVVTLGITPSFACEGYGYIRRGDSISVGFEVKEFVEKPSAVKAQEYLDQGDYLWNSGMFIMRPSILIEEAELYCPKLLDNCRQTFDSAVHDLDFIRFSEQQFSRCESISLDYAIMESTKKAVVLPVDCGWSDIGDLEALWRTNRHNSDGNVLKGDVVTLNSSNCLIQGDSRLVTVMGVEGLAVIETPDAVLVAPLNQAQLVKEMIVKLHGRDELTHHREVYRPWGSYESIDSGPNFQVKRISVMPGAKLSLQRHQFRAEHWVVVDGTATVHLDGETYSLKINESIYIPRLSVHSLANNTNDPLYLIEVQSGSYLGEDDIERLEDIYGRTSND